MSFHVGQPVVCIDASDCVNRAGLTVGKTYIIRWVGKYETPRDGVFEAVRLVEIVRQKLPGDPIPDVPFFARRFRPLVEDRKSVSFTIGADPDSEHWDNRKKRKEKV